MLDNLRLNRVLFLDIETVPQFPSYKKLKKDWKELWDRKAQVLGLDPDNQELGYQRAGIYAEFGKIICISLGAIRFQKGKRVFRIKSIYGDDEHELLLNFCNLMKEQFSNGDTLLCAHNGKEFDFPYLARRILINGLALPELLDIAGRKPWEIQHLDTMHLWKFGDYKSYTSLALLCQLFDIPSPKEDMAGGDVSTVYYQDEDLERIVRYCESDVLSVAQLILRFKGEPLLGKSEISKPNE